MATLASTIGQGFTYRTGTATQENPRVERTEQVGEPMVLTEQLLDAKLEAVEARTETKFAQLLGKLDLLGERLGAVSGSLGEMRTSLGRVESKTSHTRTIIVTTVLGAFIAVAGVIYTWAQFSVAIASFVRGH
jgi:hypothetical protein